MFEMINGLKNGFNLWKKAYFSQTVIYLILLFVGIFIITPLVILNVITATFTWGAVEADPIALLLLQLLLSNPTFWFSIILTSFTVLVIITIIIAASQIIAHNQAESGVGRYKETLKTLIAMVVPLAVVAIISGFIILIASFVYVEMIILLRNFFPLVLEVPYFSTTIKLTLLDVLGIVFYPMILILLGGPYFLATSTVVVDNAGMDAIVNGWKLYLTKFHSTLIAMIILFIIGLITVAIFFIPLSAIFITSSYRGLILGIGFILMALRVLISPFIDNWIFTSLYSFYQEIKS